MALHNLTSLMVPISTPQSQCCALNIRNPVPQGVTWLFPCGEPASPESRGSLPQATLVFLPCSLLRMAFLPSLYKTALHHALVAFLHSTHHHLTYYTFDYNPPPHSTQIQVQWDWELSLYYSLLCPLVNSKQCLNQIGLNFCWVNEWVSAWIGEWMLPFLRTASYKWKMVRPQYSAQLTNLGLILLSKMVTGWAIYSCAFTSQDFLSSFN